MSTSLNTLIETFRNEPLNVMAHGGGVADRQARIVGFSQAVLSSVTIVAAGAGGMMSAIGEGLARKGVGHLILCDDDTVHPSNLNRQMFYQGDLWRNKAISLARNLADQSFLGTRVSGVPMKIMPAIRSGVIGRHDCLVSAIDDELAREDLALYALDAGTPLVTMGIGTDGDGGYVHIQKPGNACWGCAFPRACRLRADRSYRAPCPGTPAIKDILTLVAGAALYAIDTLFMPRPIGWNYREFHLAGFMPDVMTTIPRRPDCQLCGGQAASAG
jgi:molybdopterin/thiamine biosynthesis adenylyltransferase